VTVKTGAVTLGPGRLTIADVIAVAREGAAVALDPAAAARLAQGRQALEELMRWAPHGLLESLLWRALARRRAAA
jgi:hypothetical protein